MNNNKTLIIYFSHSGNTKQIAEWVQGKINTGIVLIEPEIPYPSGYQQTIDEMSRQNKGKILPSFKKVDVNIQDYDTIFFGYPVWDMRLPPVVRTFLRDNDFSGKTILPFNSHAGYGTGKSVSEIKEFAPKAKVADAFSIKDSNVKDAKKEVERWINQMFE
ncbi:flavodoxin [Pedobacter insulae]|nr:flavodoxin [Pedobacter insulae]